MTDAQGAPFQVRARLRPTAARVWERVDGDHASQRSHVTEAGDGNFAMPNTAGSVSLPERMGSPQTSQ